MIQLWLLEIEQGNIVILHLFYALEQEVNIIVQNILAEHSDETFINIRHMPYGFTIHFTYLPPVLTEEKDISHLSSTLHLVASLSQGSG